MGNKNRKMNLNIINELVETTHFTTDEMLSYYKEFIKNHPSGYMTPEEYKNAVIQNFEKLKRKESKLD